MVFIFQHRGTKRPRRKPVVFENYHNYQFGKSAERRGGKGEIVYGVSSLCLHNSGSRNPPTSKNGKNRYDIKCTSTVDSFCLSRKFCWNTKLKDDYGSTAVDRFLTFQEWIYKQIEKPDKKWKFCGGRGQVNNTYNAYYPYLYSVRLVSPFWSL